MKFPIKQLSILFIISVMALAIMPVMAQDDLTLIDHTDELYGLTGLIPDGWETAGPGVVTRGNTEDDITLLAQQAAPVAADLVLTSLLPQLQLTEAPNAVGTHETDSLIWTLYEVEVVAGDLVVMVDVGLANADGVTYVVLMQTTPDEYDTLHEELFVPVIYALTPMIDEPMADITYTEEDVTFANDDITLAGTLTIPDGSGPHPAVILLSGSGGQDRDESLAPTSAIKPFALIADHLTRNGVAVLRFDDRGIGLSTGDYSAATSADFATDAMAALDYLLAHDDINTTQIGLLGHSEGGAIAPMVAVERPDLAFVISMAGTAVDGSAVLRVQNRRILEAEGGTEEQIETVLSLLEPLFEAAIDGESEAIENRLRDLVDYQVRELVPPDELPDGKELNAIMEEIVAEQLTLFEADWYPYFLNYNPGDFWMQVDVPVLAIFGGLDVQVDAEQNRPAMEAALQAAGNSDTTFVTIPTANHLFQDAITGSVGEYGELEPIFHPDFLPTISDWLLQWVDVTG